MWLLATSASWLCLQKTPRRYSSAAIPHVAVRCHWHLAPGRLLQGSCMSIDRDLGFVRDKDNLAKSLSRNILSSHLHYTIKGQILSAGY
jgi:hypothetical protein